MYRPYRHNMVPMCAQVQPKPLNTKVKPIGIGIREGAIALSHGSGASPYPRLGLPHPRCTGLLHEAGQPVTPASRPGLLHPSRAAGHRRQQVLVSCTRQGSQAPWEALELCPLPLRLLGTTEARAFQLADFRWSGNFRWAFSRREPKPPFSDPCHARSRLPGRQRGSQTLVGNGGH